jgi:hypothetical protein
MGPDPGTLGPPRGPIGEQGGQAARRDGETDSSSRARSSELKLSPWALGSPLHCFRIHLGGDIQQDQTARDVTITRAFSNLIAARQAVPCEPTEPNRP